VPRHDYSRPASPLETAITVPYVGAAYGQFDRGSLGLRDCRLVGTWVRKTRGEHLPGKSSTKFQTALGPVISDSMDLYEHYSGTKRHLV